MQNQVRRAKFVLAGYVLFLVAVVIAADAGIGSRFWNFIHAIPCGDKVGHFVLFGALSFLVNWILLGRSWRVGGLSVLKGSVALFLIVFAEELSQLFFKTRTFDWFDLLADAAGIWLFGLLAQYRLRRLLANSVAF